MKHLLFLSVVIFLTLSLFNYHRGEMYRLTKFSDEELSVIFPDTPPPVIIERMRPIPNGWRFIPFLHGNMASSLAPLLPFIFVPKEMYIDLRSKSPDPENIAVYVHEFIHYERLKDVPLLQASKYIISRRYRIHEELHAISAEMHYRAAQGLDYDIKRKSGHFSGPTYLWASGNKESRQVLSNLWQKIKENELQTKNTP